jgi:hypothetical protein
MAPDKTLTLEHILPKEFRNEWGFSEDEHTAYKNKLGNFALLTFEDNGSMQDALSIVDKKQVLELAKNGSLTRAVAKYKTWTKDDIDTRQKQLAEIAIKVWAV